MRKLAAGAIGRSSSERQADPHPLPRIKMPHPVRWLLLPLTFPPSDTRGIACRVKNFHRATATQR
jgi:hypothetical protein